MSCAAKLVVNCPTHGGIELWTDVVGYEGFYRVSNRGRVFSVERKVRSAVCASGFRTVPGKLLAINSGNGRLLVTLGKLGKQVTISIGQLVLTSFVGPPANNDLCCCHEDGNAYHNCPENLRWDTHEGNMKDKHRHGTQPKGESHCCAKLNWQKVRELRALKRQRPEMTVEELRVGLDVGNETVRQMLLGKTWKE